MLFRSKFPQLKCGAVHSFGIVYKDRASRVCSVIKSSVMDVYIPFYAEVEGLSLDTIVKLAFKLYHVPPVWAETGEIVYFGNVSMNYWTQIRASDISSLGNDRFSINIEDTFVWTREQNSRWKVASYEWQAGDRMRIIGKIDPSDSSVTTLYSGEAIDRKSVV